MSAALVVHRTPNSVMCYSLHSEVHFIVHAWFTGVHVGYRTFGAWALPALVSCCPVPFMLVSFFHTCCPQCYVCSHYSELLWRHCLHLFIGGCSIQRLSLCSSLALGGHSGFAAPLYHFGHLKNIPLHLSSRSILIKTRGALGVVLSLSSALVLVRLLLHTII